MGKATAPGRTFEGDVYKVGRLLSHWQCWSADWEWSGWFRGALALPRPVGTRGWTRGWTSPFPRYFGVKTVKTRVTRVPGFLVGQCRPFSSTDTGSHWASPGMLGEIPRIDSSLAQEALCPQMSSVQWCPLLDFGDDDYTWLVGDDDYIQWEIVGKPWEKHRKIWENTSGWWWWFMILIFVL